MLATYRLVQSSVADKAIAEIRVGSVAKEQTDHCLVPLQTRQVKSTLFRNVVVRVELVVSALHEFRKTTRISGKGCAPAIEQLH
mmetsp:Transcript_14946/g.47552  ORF Transcript_14946/g.47552 Transcript_14946/m.47552 type:complete len:84 (+) Transcript_14946:553-804(+)